MKVDDFKKFKCVKYVDKNHKMIDASKIEWFKNLDVLCFAEQTDGSLAVMLWIETSMPEGWGYLKGALTAPKGYEWITNSKSIMSGQRETALLRSNLII